GFSLPVRLYCNRHCEPEGASRTGQPILHETGQSSAPATETPLSDHRTGFAGKRMWEQSDPHQRRSVLVRAFLTTAALNWPESGENFRPSLAHKGFRSLA